MSSLPPDPHDPLLSVRHLGTSFGTSRGVVRAVDDVSFDLRQREAVGIVGESGSGKSTLARSIMGLVPRAGALSGSVMFDGQDIAAMSDDERRHIWGQRIALVFQDPMTSLNPVYRVGRQMSETLRLRKQMDRPAARARARELLEMVGVPEPERRLRAYPHEMSGGMRQRVCIALAVSCSPEVLIADEATTALDVTIQGQILDLLASLQANGQMALVLISHDLGVVANRTDRVIVMYGGKVVESGPTSEVFRSPRHPYTVALLDAIPRRSQPVHSRLAVIPGAPVTAVDPGPGCRFATRCARAQPRCIAEDPVLGGEGASFEHHEFACFFPVGSAAGDRPREANRVRGETVAEKPINVPGAG